ncbi:hypothetical protein H0H93_011192 [Arthromyces matolae]|nr:hypothetical protein H0H93_011192 [Arthromyces matolae]
MIMTGLILEDDQRKLAAETVAIDTNDHPTTNQLTNILERSNQLRRKIKSWFDTQLLYMPEAARERQKSKQNGSPDGIQGTKAYDIVLWLPSQLASKGIIVDQSLRQFEWNLRMGQVNDSLEDIRRTLRLRSYLYNYKDRFSRGVKANTRSTTTITAATQRLHEASTKYQVARKAMVTLSHGLETPPSWRTTFRDLRAQDLRPLSEGLLDDTEGKRTVSWIWLQYPMERDDNDEDPRFNEAVRIEWCRARARMLRWSEEVDLLQEEMRRILQFLKWESERWRQRGTIKMGGGKQEHEGRVAYAHSQAEMRLNLCRHFKDLWREVPLILAFFGIPEARVALNDSILCSK